MILFLVQLGLFNHLMSLMKSFNMSWILIRSDLENFIFV
uniref:Uncharacterized protein n=1 Tax=Anguilla anguilla TaxID=7936 RepID=A0A0E9Q4Y8_ANGAN